MDPPRSASSKTAKVGTQRSHAFGSSSASMSDHPHLAFEVGAGGRKNLQSNTARARRTTARRLEPEDVLGQFSFAPATQTTVVTTTTTTTTNFPPLIIKQPRNVQDLDPVLFPLANVRTPELLKNQQFMIGDRRVAFHEADDAAGTLDQVSWVGLFTSYSADNLSLNLVGAAADSVAKF